MGQVPGGYAARFLTYQGTPVWRHSEVLRWTLQLVSGFVVAVLVVWFIANMAGAVQDRGIPHGWSFLDREYGTPIGQHFLPYESSDSFGYALGVAAVNTVVVSLVGMALAVALGAAVGLGLLSGNWLAARLAAVYVDVFRNVPLLVQLFFWFYIVLALPPVREGHSFGGSLFVNNGGVSLPFPSVADVGAAVAWLLLAAGALAAGYAVFRRLEGLELRTGRSSYPVYGGLAAAVFLGALAWLAVGLAAGEAPFAMSFPEPQGRFGRLSGGVTAPAGLVVLLVGLATYSAAFVAEAVRSGVESVRRGQHEGARALGLGRLAAWRYVTFPQALRVILPRLNGQLLEVTKNSSLAGAIGYADLTNVGKTMTQTGPALSVFLLVIAGYLSLSLTYSAVGALYDRHVRATGGVLPGGSPAASRRRRLGAGPDERGPWGWMRRNLFESWPDAVVTASAAAVAGLALFQGLRWVLTVADWSVVGVLGGQLVIGQYNSEVACPGQNCFWRPQAALLLFSVLLGMAWGLFGNPVARRVGLGAAAAVSLFALLPYGFERMGLDVRLLLAANLPALLAGWGLARFTGIGGRGIVVYAVLGFLASMLLIRGVGAVPGLQAVAVVHWGGLMLNLVLAIGGIIVSFPLGIGLALGRRSELPVVRWVCLLVVQAFRGVPLITLLFMSQVLVPLAFPETFPANSLFRAAVVHAVQLGPHGGEHRGGIGVPASAAGQRRAGPGSAGLADDGVHIAAAGRAERDPGHCGAVHLPLQGHDADLRDRDAGPLGGQPGVHPGQRRLSLPRHGDVRVLGGRLLGVRLHHVVCQSEG